MKTKTVGCERQRRHVQSRMKPPVSGELNSELHRLRIGDVSLGRAVFQKIDGICLPLTLGAGQKRPPRLSYSNVQVLEAVGSRTGHRLEGELGTVETRISRVS